MNILGRKRNGLFGRNANSFRSNEASTVAQCRIHAQLNRKQNFVKSLADVEFRGFSQWGEDGIIDWLVELLSGIPTTFVEFGVENYSESNTRMLLWLRNWRGLIIDGSEDNIADVRAQDVSWRFDLASLAAFIDIDNVNRLVSSSGLSGDIGLLSIDIDGNDYWVWKSVEVLRPVIVICEYNAVLGDLRNITTPYRKDFQRGKAHPSNLYFGSSVAALIKLGKEKGYEFLGTNSNGCNAFFVRNDWASRVLPSIQSVVSFPSLFRESRDELGKLTYASHVRRLDLIKHLKVIDLDLMKDVAISELGDLYSSEWRTEMGC